MSSVLSSRIFSVLWLLLVAWPAGVVEATHARFANYNWRRASVTSRTITAEITQGWRSGFIQARGIPKGAVLTNNAFPVNWGDGTGLSKNVATVRKPTASTRPFPHGAL